VEIGELEAGEPGEGEEMPDLLVTVSPAAGEKCQRCWRYDRQLTPASAAHPGICPRCLAQLED
jgi:isoleucyl-tRNA synthetase